MPIHKLYIDKEISDNAETINIRSKINVPAIIVENSKEIFEIINSSDDPIKSGKEILFLTRNKGAFIKKCPGTREYICCDYYILHIGSYCIMDCSYCILQTYFHPPILQYFVNQLDLFYDIEKLLLEKKICRIGTGEFTDSLIWELWTDNAVSLIDKFSQQSNIVLELKTKTTAIERLQYIKHNSKTIIAWSLNTRQIIHTEERYTASLTNRIKAAQKCQSWGYPLAFHFDPLVIYDGCEKDYLEVIEELFSVISPDNIVWISLGSFRFIPALKLIIQKRFFNSKIIYGEFISGLDGKMRYFKPLRINLYRKIISYISKIAPDVTVYLCMEDDETWYQSFGFKPSERGGLPKMLDIAASLHCGLKYEN